MSLQFVIDGYNIIHHPIFIKHTISKIKDSRAALIGLIKTHRLCGSPKNKISIVFDGYPDLSCERLERGDMEIIFSRKETADERIKKIVEKYTNPKTIVAVSDDKEIKLFIKSIGGGALSVEEFIAPKQNKDETLKPELTYIEMCKINKELRQIWLKE